MSVVAACVFSDRVFIGADCRLTAAEGPGEGRRRHYDNLLKVYPCGPYSVLGFVGDDVAGASAMVRRLLLQLIAKERRIRDERRPPPSSRLSLWLPGFLRWAYVEDKAKAPLGFMLASLVPRVPLRERQSHAGQAGYEGLVQFMQSPQFKPRPSRPGAVAVMGSGGPLALRGLSENAEILRHGYRDDLAAHLVLDRAIATCCVASDIDTVGGLRPTYEISADGVRAVQHRSYGDGVDDVSLEFLSPALWVQRNATAGTSQEIVPLWQAIRQAKGASRTFDVPP